MLFQRYCFDVTAPMIAYDDDLLPLSSTSTHLIMDLFQFGVAKLVRLKDAQKLLKNEFEQLEQQLLLLRSGCGGDGGDDGRGGAGRHRRWNAITGGDGRRGTATDVRAVGYLLTGSAREERGTLIDETTDR